MTSPPNILANPGVIGAKVSIASGVVSFCAQGLPVAQFAAAVLGAIAAIVSIAWVVVQFIRTKK